MLDKEFNLKKMYDDLQKMYSVKELEQAEKELLDLKKKMLAESKGISGKDMRDQYNNLTNKYNEIQKMHAYNEYIDVGAQIERMEKLLELINDFAEKINDKIDERLANTEGENIYETKWGRDDPEKVMEDYNSVVEEAFKDPDVKEIMDKIDAL